jgi:ApaG protein
VVKTLTTKNIKVSVISKYEPGHSAPGQAKFIHAYWIKIENQSDSAVQLLSREWLIKDSNLIIRQVSGDGVIGKQPIIESGSFHQYSSWCPITTDIGQMSGTYKMKRLVDNSTFFVEIPAFTLIYPPKLN